MDVKRRYELLILSITIFGLSSLPQLIATKLHMTMQKYNVYFIEVDIKNITLL